MPKKTYYGPQTLMALDNFPFPHRQVYAELIYAIAEVKKATAIGNMKAGDLDETIAEAIGQAADEVIAGKHDDQFPTVGLQGGAGTSIHMNVNEVLAARAEELLHQKKITRSVHPNDHVNMSQSTNDVNPSALRIACIRLSESLISELKALQKTFEEKAKEFAHVQKLARTHIQDAVPTTLGAECSSYAAMIERDITRIEHAKELLFELNLGGTAVGNAINASKAYRKESYKALCQITGMELKEAKNLMSFTSSGADICALSGAVTIACMTLSKIAIDLRFMASGPMGGIGEIRLEQLQPGSSIMPGKVNPVMPEAISQLYYFVNGKNMTIHQAAEASHLELAVMFPILADGIITVLKMSASVIGVFRKKCVATMEADEERCKEHLEKSTAYATLLSPLLGYDTTSAVVKEAVKRKTSIRAVVLEKGLMSEEDFNRAITV